MQPILHLINFLNKIQTLIEQGIRPWAFKNPFRIGFIHAFRIIRARRFTHLKTNILGKQVILTDAYWYLFTYKEILHDEIYLFKASTETPVIIDCGSNIGLSVIYFKYLYPRAKIITFEPDPIIFNVLERNLCSFGFEDVIAYEKAVWYEEGSLSFLSDGGVGGRLSDQLSDGRTYQVQTVRLRDFLAEHVDFLKIDIEGAEYEVLLDCADRLVNVDFLFVEYHSDSLSKQSLQDILRIIQEAGFRYHIKDANPIAHPFITQERNTYFDLQLNIFAFRV